MHSQILAGEAGVSALTGLGGERGRGVMYLSLVYLHSLTLGAREMCYVLELALRHVPLTWQEVLVVSLLNG